MLQSVGHYRKKICIFRICDNTADFMKRIQNTRDFNLPPRVFEALTLLGCCAASICKLLQTFRENLTVSFRRIKHFWMDRTLKMGLIVLHCFALEY